MGKSLKNIDFIYKRGYFLVWKGGRIAAAGKEKSIDEESPGFTETRYQITSGWRNPRESAAENYRRLNVGKVEKAR